MANKGKNSVAEKFKLLGSIKQNATEIDNLTTGALVALVCGTFVIAIGELVWIPFAMSSSVLGYRSLLAYANRDRRKHAEKIEMIQDALILSENISKSSLPEKEKNRFFDEIPKLIEPSNSQPLILPPKKNTFPQILDDKGKPINQKNDD